MFRENRNIFTWLLLDCSDHIFTFSRNVNAERGTRRWTGKGHGPRDEGEGNARAKADIQMTIIISSGWRRNAGDILFKIQSRNSLVQEDR